MKQTFIIVTDGACMKNPGPGGWGLIMATPTEVFEWGGYEAESTNNRMELMGFYRGLQEVYRRIKDLADHSQILVRVISDSKYVLDGAEKFVWSWQKNGWLTQVGDDVKNKEIWEKIVKGLEKFRELKIKMKYELVKGHSGNDANERADQIAVKFSRGEDSELKLYQGSLESYPISFETGEPYPLTYLSYVSGKISRHKTWESCKAATDGRPGSKFKKVTNRLQEAEVLKEWGVET